jgi:hypothetical protein
MRTYMLAAAQMICQDGDVRANLEHASALAQQASHQGAQLLLFPEFMPQGYLLTPTLWDAAEPFDGITICWLTETARTLGIYVGTNFLEAKNGHLLFYRAGSGAFPFTTVHGETVQMSGQGIYFHDTLFTVSLSWGTDLVTLFICVPLLALSAWRCQRGSLRGGILLTGVLAYFLYYGASLGLGTAYNRLFLVYITLFSASFYAFIRLSRHLTWIAWPNASHGARHDAAWRSS